MKATQILAPGRIRFVEITKPPLLSGHAIIKPHYLSLCGSDIHMLYYDFSGPFPSPLGASGHEMVGVIEEIDSTASPAKVGDWVLALSPMHLAMTECIQVPVNLIIALPTNLPPQILLQSQQLGTVIHACKQLPNMIGKTAVIIGQGSAGLYFNYLLKRLGADIIIGLDLEPHRISMSKFYGATHAILNSGTNCMDAVAEITNNSMADLVIEAAGEVSSINLAPHLVKQHGNIIYFGIPRAPIIPFNFQVLFSKYCRTTTVSGAAHEPGLFSTHLAARMIASGEINVEPLITHTFSFANVMAAYDMAHKRADNCLKVVVKITGDHN